MNIINYIFLKLLKIEDMNFTIIQFFLNKFYEKKIFKALED